MGKNFKENAAMQFISQDSQQETQEIPAGFKRNPEYIEVKSKRVQLVMQPSLYQKAKSAADAQGISFNAYIHQVLEKELQDN